MVTGSSQPRTGPSLPSASPIHTELILTRWWVGTLQILLCFLLGFLGFIFLLQHRSAGCLPLQVADEVTHFSATLQEAQDSKAEPHLPVDFPLLGVCGGGVQVPGRRPKQLWVKLSPVSLQHAAEHSQQVPPGTCVPRVTEQSARHNSRETPHYLRTLILLYLFYKAPGEAKHSPHTSLDSASCQLEQNKWWESWGNRIDVWAQDVLFSSGSVLSDYQANTYWGNSHPALFWFSTATASPALMAEGMTSKSLLLSAQLAEHN